MNNKKLLRPKDKELKLLEKINKAKSELLALQEKRKTEIGHLAYKHHLDTLDNQTLNSAFAQIAKEYVHGNA